MADPDFHDRIVEHIADVISEKEIHISNQSVERQLLNGGFDGLTLSQSDDEADWQEYLAAPRGDEDDIIWDDVLLCDAEEIIEENGYSPNLPESWIARPKVA